MPSVVDLSGIQGRLSNLGNNSAGAQLYVEGQGQVLVPHVTELSRIDLQARYGGVLALTNLTTLYLTNASMSLQAQELGSLLDLSSVTKVVISAGYTLSVSASTGSKIDLRRRFFRDHSG